MKIRNVLAITKKEIRAVLDNPSSYIVLIAFGVLWQFMFFRSAFLIGEASLRELFGNLPWMFLILIPAVTMGLISKEKESSTLELVLTHPVNEFELILGKFLGALVYVLTALFFTIPIAVAFSRFGVFDWGVYFAQFVGSVLFAFAFVAFGIYVSSLFKNVIAALLVTVGAGFLLTILGTDLISSSLPYSISVGLERLSFSGHLRSINRGVFDLRDLWYFLSATIMFLYLTYLQFLKTKYGVNRKRYFTYQTAAILIVGIVIMTNVIGNRIPGRLDLTRDKIYTLSGSTKTLLDDLDDIVKVTFYISAELPAQYTPTVREIRDMLKDYENLGKGNLTLEYKDPLSSEELEVEAQQEGIQPIQFNVIGQEEFQVKRGYLGMVISYGGQSEVIPFVNNVNDLEYEMTSLISKLTTVNKKKIGFLAGHGEKNPITEMSVFFNELRRQFDVLIVTPEEETNEINYDYDVLVIAGADQTVPQETLDNINTAINNGRDVLLLVDKFNIDIANQVISGNIEPLQSFIADYGVVPRINAIYDLQAHNTIRIDNGMFSVFVPYPFWIKALPASEDSQITKKISAVDIPWGASLEIEEETVAGAGYRTIPILKTTQYAGEQMGSLDIDPEQEFPRENLSEKIMAVALEPVQEAPASSKGKIIVVGDSDFLTDQFTAASTQNLAFGMNSVSWLTDSESLADIRVKNRISSVLYFEDEMQPQYIKFGSISLMVLAPALYGLLRAFGRKNKRSQKYEF